MTTHQKVKTAALYIICSAACAYPVVMFINILLNP